MSRKWDFNEVDRECGAKLEGFLPDSLFDTHVHVYKCADLHTTPESFFCGGPEEVGADVWREELGKQLGPQRLKRALFVATPTAGSDLPRLDEFLIGEVAKEPECYGVVSVTVDMDPDLARANLSNPRIIGFKPYHLFAHSKPTWHARIGEYIPDWAWELCQERGLFILLHMVRDLALADPDNQAYITEKCKAYPDAKLILAHCARGFHAPNTIDGIHAIKGLKNVYFDGAAVCESAGMIAIIQHFGLDRLMWASDFPVSQDRGRCVTMGDGFVWVRPSEQDTAEVENHGKPTLVGIETVRAFRETALALGLSKSEISDLFYGNAVRLLSSVG